MQYYWKVKDIETVPCAKCTVSIGYNRVKWALLQYADGWRRYQYDPVNGVWNLMEEGTCANS